VGVVISMGLGGVEAGMHDEADAVREQHHVYHPGIGTLWHKFCTAKLSIITSLEYKLDILQLPIYSTSTGLQAT
jgi:hypothetical protein